MSLINGKYNLVKHEGVEDYMVAFGTPKENLGFLKDIKAHSDISVDGKKVKITSEWGQTPKTTIEYTDGVEIDDQSSFGLKLKSTLTLKDNEFLVVSKYPDNSTGSKHYKFDDKGAVLTLNRDKHEAKLYFTRA